jgi:radical SAM superfamily enzyme YgiQ (UPF0313 family)
MKILLVSMPFENASIMTGGKFDMRDTDAYCLGLGYLHSYLESKGHDVKTLSMNHNPAAIDEIAETFRTRGVPDMIGINTLTFNRTSSFGLVEWLHKNYPSILITMGGIHATICYEQILKKYPYVVIVRGEGEITMAELAGSPANLLDTPGLAISVRGVPVLTEPRPLICDLDTLPFPNHRYFQESAHRVAANMMTSRGCPNRCSFCCLNPTAGTTVRFRSVKNSVDEIEYIYKNFTNVKIIQFCDDAFFTRPSRVVAICNEIVKRGIKLKFICQARAKPCTREMAEAMQRAGFYMITIGMETGDPGILKGIHKNFSLADILNLYEVFKGTGIKIFVLQIVGLPGETWESMRNTGRFVQKLQGIQYNFYAFPNLAMVFPGTELARNMYKAGIITEDFWMTDTLTPVYTVDHPLAELEAMQEELIDWVSCDRLWTREGFRKQWRLIPAIYWYKFWHFIWPRYVTKEEVW